ncbi:hypothetical protein [Streptomyces sp. NPDC002402]
MPNQLAVVRVLTENVVGPQIWNGLVGECRTMPTTTYDEVEEAMAAVLERVAAAVNWPRLLAEASWRHSTLHEKTLEDEDRPAGDGTPWECHARGVCGECLRHALLSPETGAHRWQDHPDVPLTRQGLDWAKTVTDTIGYRRTPATKTASRPAAGALEAELAAAVGKKLTAVLSTDAQRATALAAYHLIADTDGPGVARAWLIGINPHLNDKAPLLAIRAGQGPAALQAAQAHHNA